MSLYVVRHGQVPSNVEGIISGSTDEQLTEKGIEQAIKIKKELQSIKFDVVYSSPIARAKQTAEIIAPQNNIILDPRLAERDPGIMLGKSRKSIDKNAWNSLDMDRTFEGAETLKAGLKRVKSFLEEIHAKDEEKTVLVVTHNFISKCIWILENNIQNKDLINDFFHDNGDIKFYRGRKIDFEDCYSANLSSKVKKRK